MNQNITTAVLGLFVGGLLVSLAIPLQAQGAQQAQEEAQRFERIMENTVIEGGINLEGIRFAQAISLIRERLPFDIHTHSNVRDQFEADVGNRNGPELTISFQNDIEVARLLRFILDRHNLAAQYSSGAIQIVTEDQHMQPVLRFYDVRDLTIQLEEYPGPSLELTPPNEDSGGDVGDFGAGLEPGDTAGLVQEESDLMILLEDHVASDTWSNDGVNIQLQGGFLLISQAPTVHEEIQRFLNNLRALR